MSWARRSLLWDLDGHPNVDEFVFETSSTANFDPWSLGDGGALSNGDRTMTDGSAASTSQVFGYPDRDYVFVSVADGTSGFCAEFTIDSVDPSQAIVLFPFCYYPVPGDPVVPQGYYSTAAQLQQSEYREIEFVPVLEQVFDTGDVIGLLVYEEHRCAWFKNGVLLRHEPFYQYAAVPVRFGVKMNGGQISVQSALGAMVYGTVYTAFVGHDDNDYFAGLPRLPVGSWLAP